MISARLGVIAMTLALGVGQHLAQAQVLSDPMRPPAFAAPGGAGEQTSGGVPVLQSTLLSKGRRIAMIDGKPMNVGDRIGAASIIAIDPSTVTLREGKTTTALRLFQAVKLTRPAAAKATASRKRAKEGEK